MAFGLKLTWRTALAAAAICVLGLVFAFSPRPIAVETAALARGGIVDAVTDQGAMRVREAFIVSAPVGGRLERLTLKPGDRVAVKGEIARIRPQAADFLDPRAAAQAQAAIRAASAAVGAAQAGAHASEARRALAEAELARVRTLAQRNVASPRALETAEAQAAAARDEAAAANAMVRARRADLTAAQAALTGPGAATGDAVGVRAPIAGIVTRVFQESERSVAAGAPLVEISDRQGLEAAIEFLSQDAVRIAPGQSAEIIDWGGPAVPARVRRVEPQGFTKVSALGVEEQRVIVLLQPEGPPGAWQGLGPGYRVWGRVRLRETPDALLAPIGALTRGPDGWAVYRVEGGRAVRTRVEVGVLTDQSAEIRQGAKVGDKVVVFPSDRIVDGVRVRPLTKR
jgi:HlyD family secretion protein